MKHIFFLLPLAVGCQMGEVNVKAGYYSLLHCAQIEIHYSPVATAAAGEGEER